MTLRATNGIAGVCLFTLLAAASAYATNLTVDCKAKKNNSIQAALNLLSKQGPHTITVSGACNQAVLIEKFDDLTLVTTTGASINDPTPLDLEDNNAVNISQSRNVTLQGFTINGGVEGVACFDFSVCILRELVLEGQSDNGVAFSRSSGFVDNTTIQNTLFSGLGLFSSSEVLFGSGIFAPGTSTIQNNGTADNGSIGVNVQNGSHLALLGVTIQDHDFGDGVSVGFGSLLRVFNSTITGNAGNGISVTSAIVRLLGSFGPNSVTNNGGNGVNLAFTSTMQAGAGGPLNITGNTGHGVFVGHLSFVRLGGTRTITGNASPDVNCSASTAKTSGVGDSTSPNLGGGTTNCTEPAP